MLAIGAGPGRVGVDEGRSSGAGVGVGDATADLARLDEVDDGEPDADADGDHERHRGEPGEDAAEPAGHHAGTSRTSSDAGGLDAAASRPTAGRPRRPALGRRAPRGCDVGRDDVSRDAVGQASRPSASAAWLP